MLVNRDISTNNPMKIVAGILPGVGGVFFLFYLLCISAETLLFFVSVKMVGQLEEPTGDPATVAPNSQGS